MTTTTIGHGLPGATGILGRAPAGWSAEERMHAARERIARLEGRHASGEHFLTWTGKLFAGRRVLGCQLCSLRTLDGADVPLPVAA